MSETDRQPRTVPAALTTWHQDLFAAMSRWSWLQSLEEGVSGVTQPVYER